MTADLKPAATVIVLRDSPRGPEIFMVRRHEATAFMGGAYVFPGGRVDPADLDAAGGDEMLAFRLAAIRELFEEAGVLLARRSGTGLLQDVRRPVPDLLQDVRRPVPDPLQDVRRPVPDLRQDVRRPVPDLRQDVRRPVPGLPVPDLRRFAGYRSAVHDGRLTLAEIAAREQLELVPEALVPFAHWVTPPVDTRRFDTRFFVTRVPPEQTPIHDEAETTHSLWTTAAEALARDRRDEIVLPPPTWTTLRELEPFATVDEALRWAAARTIVRREPRFRQEHDERMLVLPGDPLNPEPWHEALVHETRFVHEGGRWRARRA